MMAENVDNNANESTVHTEQPNSVRLIYTLSRHPPKYRYCLLKTGFYLAKVPRSDELMRFTETDMFAIVRTMLFVHVFGVTATDPMLDMINSGHMRDIANETLFAQTPKPLTVKLACAILDSLFGENFSTIVRRPVRRVMLEYTQIWRYFKVGVTISLPSTSDFIKIYRFGNVISPEYSDATAFVNNNLLDHKVFLQGAVKRLDCKRNASRRAPR